MYKHYVKSNDTAFKHNIRYQKSNSKQLEYIAKDHIAIAMHKM